MEFSFSQLTVDVFLQVLPWLLLFITIASAFIKSKLVWFCLIITLLSAFLLNTLNFVGISTVVLLFTLSFIANKSTHCFTKLLLTSLVIILCITLAAHLLPGFNNLLILDKVEKSVNSREFTLYLNLDKPMIIFALLLMVPTILQPIERLGYYNNLSYIHLFILILVGFIVVFLLASVFGLIKFEPILPRWWWLFALNNLLLTCVAEELFFRGFIQQKLTKYFNPFIGLLAASTLFGIAHVAGGFTYVVVATLAGVLYGIIYQATGKITYAILGHFVLNFIHFSLFTYPLVK